MGGDEAALLRLWQEKRGEIEPADLSGELIVQLGLVTEDLNRAWYERHSGHRVGQVQRRRVHASIVWMAATLDGLVEETGAVFEAKFMLPWSFSEQAAAEKHMPQLQHNMMVVGSKERGALDHHRRRPMGRDRGVGRSDLPDRPDVCRTGVLARRSAAVSPLACSMPSRPGPGSRRFGWST